MRRQKALQAGITLCKEKHYMTEMWVRLMFPLLFWALCFVMEDNPVAKFVCLCIQKIKFSNKSSYSLYACSAIIYKVIAMIDVFKI